MRLPGDLVERRGFPECDTCLRIARAGLPSEPLIKRGVPRFTREQLNAMRKAGEIYSEFIARGGVRHILTVSRIEGQYALPGLKDQYCSYRGTPHKRGLLVRSLCGKLLQVGRTCAGNDFGADVADQLFGAVDRGTHVDQVALRALNDPAELRRRFSAVKVLLGKRLDGKNALQEHCPRLYGPVYSRAQSGPKSHDFRVRKYDRKNEHEYWVVETYVFKGLELFKTDFERRLQMDVLEYDIAQCEVELPRLVVDEKNCDRLAALLDDHSTRIRSKEAAIEKASRFWWESNLEHICTPRSAPATRRSLGCEGRRSTSCRPTSR
jgi:hypothetical protein